MPEPIELSAATELALTPEHSSDYNALVRPHLRFVVTRYFAERWVPTLGLYYRGASAIPLASAGKAAGRTAWFILQLRQIVYWNDHEAVQGEHACRRSLEFLVRESGLRRDTIQAVLAEALCQWFVHRQSGDHYYDSQRQHPVRAQNTYLVRMDEPLVPADAECLTQVLASCRPGGADPMERALERVRWALQQPREHLRAPDIRGALRQPERFMAEQPLEVLDLVRLAEPGLADMPAGDERWKVLLAACDQLAEHVIAPQDVLGDSYYFRKHWVKALGRGQAWLVVLLRDRCYDRPGDEVRDVCWVPDYDWLAQRVGVDARTIGAWLGDGLQGFVQIREQRKGWDKGDPQRVGYRVWVRLHDPLTEEDEQEYQRRLAARLSAQHQVLESVVRGESGLSGSGVRRENELPGEVRGENGLSGVGVKSESGLSAAGVKRENGLSAEHGSGENPSGGESFKALKNQGESQNHQTSPSGLDANFAAIHTALEKLSTGNDDDVDLDQVLKVAGIQNPSRNRILNTQPRAADVLAWLLSAASTPAIKGRPGFLVSKLLNREESMAPPDPFGQLARLAPSQWTAFAVAARWRAKGAPAPWGLSSAPDDMELFDRWWHIYGAVELAELPFGLGVAAAQQWAIESQEQAHGKTGMAMGRSGFGKWAADYA